MFEMRASERACAIIDLCATRVVACLGLTHGSEHIVRDYCKPLTINFESRAILSWLTLRLSGTERFADLG